MARVAEWTSPHLTAARQVWDAVDAALAALKGAPADAHAPPAPPKETDAPAGTHTQTEDRPDVRKEG